MKYVRRYNHRKEMLKWKRYNKVLKRIKVGLGFVFIPYVLNFKITIFDEKGLRDLVLSETNQ